MLLGLALFPSQHLLVIIMAWCKSALATFSRSQQILCHAYRVCLHCHVFRICNDAVKLATIDAVGHCHCVCVLRDRTLREFLRVLVLHIPLVFQTAASCFHGDSRFLSVRHLHTLGQALNGYWNVLAILLHSSWVYSACPMMRRIRKGFHP